MVINPWLIHNTEACASGTTCQVLNAYYYQCLTPSSTATTAPSSSPTTITTTTKPTTTPTTTTTGPTTTPPPPSATGFVKTSGTAFTLNGSKFTVVGSVFLVQVPFARILNDRSIVKIRTGSGSQVFRPPIWTKRSPISPPPDQLLCEHGMSTVLSYHVCIVLMFSMIVQGFQWSD